MSADHWQKVYSSKKADQVSWYQSEPEVSLRLTKTNASFADAIIDVGAGQSSLVDRLVQDGYSDVTVLDISDSAVEEIRNRLDGASKFVSFVVADVSNWRPTQTFDFWHDRAVFHFLTSTSDIDAYLSVVSQAVRRGGVAVIGTFAEDGPTQCSGLDVSRYSPKNLVSLFSEYFEFEASELEKHVTPAGAVQHFTWVTLRRK
ncbi:class I SAM-dependent methyltransferase [bacterium]|nr:class I SAM-dependent methyltransferase [bacterium]